jgi:hypothetical protein
MATDELSERLKASFTRARAKLSAARHLLDGGFGPDAVPPAYYAAFHVAEAAWPPRATSLGATRASRASSASGS